MTDKRIKILRKLLHHRGVTVDDISDSDCYIIETIKELDELYKPLIPSEEELQEIILNNCLKIRKQQTIFNVEQTAKAIHDDLQNRLNKKGD